MATTDTSLTVVNSMTESNLDSLKDSNGKVPSLANQLIMTPDDDGVEITDVQVDSSSVVSNGVANISTMNSNYNASSNKIATASDISGKENASNKVTSISSSSTDTQYPSAKCVYTALSGKQATLVSGTNIKTINSTSILGSGDISTPVTTVKVDGTSITSNNEADLKTINGNYNSSSNKLATANDLATKQNTLPTTSTAGKVLKSTSTAGTVEWGDSSGSVDIDNTSITENSSNPIQTIGVIDQKTGNANKQWTGTKAEYEALGTHDANTFYNITDDVANEGNLVADVTLTSNSSSVTITALKEGNYSLTIKSLSNESISKVINFKITAKQTINENNFADFHQFMRKFAGHGTVFLITAIFGFLFFYSYFEVEKEKHMFGLTASLLIGFIVAGLSELIQKLVPGRYGSWDDIGIDYLGYVLGTLITLGIYLIIYFVKKTKRKKD